MNARAFGSLPFSRHAHEQPSTVLENPPTLCDIAAELFAKTHEQVGEQAARKCWFEMLDARAKAPVSMLGFWSVLESDQPSKFLEWTYEWVAVQRDASIRDATTILTVIVDDRTILTICKAAA